MYRKPICHTGFDEKKKNFSQFTIFLEQTHSVTPYTRLLYTDYTKIDYVSLFRVGRRYSETLQHLELGIINFSLDIISLLSFLSNLKTFKLFIYCKCRRGLIENREGIYNACECKESFQYDLTGMHQLKKLEKFIYLSKFSHSDYIFPMMLAMMPSLDHIEAIFMGDVNYQPRNLDAFLNYLAAGKNRIKTLKVTASTKFVIKSILTVKGMNLIQLELYFFESFLRNDILMVGKKYSARYPRIEGCDHSWSHIDTTFIRKVSEFTDGKKLLHFKQRFDSILLDMDFFANKFPNLETLHLGCVPNMTNDECLSKLTKLKVSQIYLK